MGARFFYLAVYAARWAALISVGRQLILHSPAVMVSDEILDKFFGTEGNTSLGRLLFRAAIGRSAVGKSRKARARAAARGRGGAPKTRAAPKGGAKAVESGVDRLLSRLKELVVSEVSYLDHASVFNGNELWKQRWSIRGEKKCVSGCAPLPPLVCVIVVRSNGRVRRTQRARDLHRSSMPHDGGRSEEAGDEEPIPGARLFPEVPGARGPFRNEVCDFPRDRLRGRQRRRQGSWNEARFAGGRRPAF